MQNRITRYETCDSTNERGLCALKDGSGSHGDVHVTSHQTQGRGRRGNTWWSEHSGGLYLSIIWCPQATLNGVLLTLAGGLGVYDCVRDLGMGQAKLKWPNDLMVGNKKLAGVLAETRGFDPSQPRFVVGVGLNVLQQDFPPSLEQEREVTSLAREGIDTTLPAAETSLLKALSQRLAQAERDPDSLGRDFLVASGLAGARVRVCSAAQTVEGTLRGLDFDSEPTLRLETGPGEEQTLVTALISTLTLA